MFHTGSSAMERSYLHQRSPLLHQPDLVQHVPNSYPSQTADNSLPIRHTTQFHHQNYVSLLCSAIKIQGSFNAYSIHPLLSKCPQVMPVSTILASLFSIYFVLSCTIVWCLNIYPLSPQVVSSWKTVSLLQFCVFSEAVSVLSSGQKKDQILKFLPK